MLVALTSLRVSTFTAAVTSTRTRLREHSIRLAVQATTDRGDVPGWVLVSVMTAGLVTAIWLIADDQLTGVLDRALTSVATP